jgi:hypothetical protein
LTTAVIVCVSGESGRPSAARKALTDSTVGWDEFVQRQMDAAIQLEIFNEKNKMSRFSKIETFLRHSGSEAVPRL